MHSTLEAKDTDTVRPISVGETLEHFEGPQELPETKELRIRCRGEKDTSTGWVTIKDGEGTTYLK